MKNLQLKNVLKATALVLGFAPLVSFANDKYEPSYFDFEPKELASLVDVTNSASSLTSTPIAIYCQSDIDVSGKAVTAKCFDQYKIADIESQTERALKQLSFTPAKVDGDAVPVRMRYRVLYAVMHNELNVELIPNLGSMQNRYGRDYIAPQERLDKTDWYSSYSENSLVNGQDFLSDGVQATVAATIGKDGKADVVRTGTAERAYKRDVKVVQNAVRRSHFIPGFVDGRPVSMGYLAVISYGGNSNEAVSSR